MNKRNKPWNFSICATSFIAIAEAGGFARAVDRLHVTQSALWKQIHDSRNRARGEAIRVIIVFDAIFPGVTATIGGIPAVLALEIPGGHDSLMASAG